MVTKKRISAAAAAAFFLALATVPADAVRFPKFKFAKKGHNATDWSNIGDRTDLSRYLDFSRARDISEAHQRKEREREAGLGCSSPRGWRYCLIKKKIFAGPNFSPWRKKALTERYKWLPNTGIKRSSDDSAE